MSNTFAPNGFTPVGRQDAVTPSFGQTVRQIASSNTHTICTGDVVFSSGGYLDIAAPGTVQIAGIFVGCKYQSIARQQVVWSPQYLGSDAAGPVEAYIIDDPNSVFLVQVGGSALGPVVIADVDQNIQFAVGTPNTATGRSGAYVVFTTVATTATLPFRVMQLLSSNDLTMNNDNASANNWVHVRFNNQDFNTTLGIA